MVGAINTKRCGRIELQSLGGNWFAAIVAMTVFVIIHALEGFFDALQLDRATTFLFKMHFLILQGIHPRQTTDSLLIKFDRLAIIF